MKIIKELTAQIGAPLFFIGGCVVVVFSVVSFNQGRIEFTALAIGFTLLIFGWLLTRYAKRSAFHIILDFILHLWP